MFKDFEVVGEESAHRKIQNGEREVQGKKKKSRVLGVDKLRGWPGHGSHGSYDQEFQLLEGSR